MYMYRVYSPATALSTVISVPPTGTVRFIDFEYADVNHSAYDIGNYFCEFAGKCVCVCVCACVRV